MDPLEEFDHLVIFDPSSFIFKGKDVKIEDNLLLTVEPLSSVLIEGLSERLVAIKLVLIPLRSNTSLPAYGLKLNPSLTNSSIIRGPRSGTDEGKHFQDFWGKKSEIRHLDGDLFECVLWDSSKNIILQIIDFVLTRHFTVSGVEIGNVRAWYQISATRLNALLSSFVPSRASFYFPSRASTLHLIRTVDQLNSLLRELNDHLPLNIVGAQAVSAEFRGTAVFAPILTIPDEQQNKERLKIAKGGTKQTSWQEIHHTIEPIYVTINIETSGKWPRDNLNAFLHMKRLFILRIHELLIQKGVPSRVVDNGLLDVFLNGVVLRVSFYQPLENMLLKITHGLIKPKRNHLTHKAVEEIEKEVKEEALTTSSIPAVLRDWVLFYDRLPAVTAQLSTISRTHLNTFPESCRLAKRWLSTHGLPVLRCPDVSSEPKIGITGQQTSGLGDGDLGVTNSRLSEVAVELMMVRAGNFTLNVDGSVRDDPSASPLATFLRFLKLIFTFNWAEKPMLVDLNEGFIEGEGPSKLEKALLAFRRTARKDKPALVIITPLDLSGIDWTQSGPTLDGLVRLQTLAKRTHDLLRAMLIGGAKLSDLKAAFRQDLAEVDVLLLLKPSVFKTRILEGVDIDAPSWALKHSGEYVEGENVCIIRGKEKPKEEPAPVTLDLANPGGGFWPKGYLCDPLLWLIRQLHTYFGNDLFDVMWDRHSARWIGLKFKHPEAFQQLALFTGPESEVELTGLVCHREIPGVEGQIGVAVNVHNLLEMLRLWSPDFIDSIRVQEGGKPIMVMPGSPVMTLDQSIHVLYPLAIKREIKEAKEKKFSRKEKKRERKMKRLEDVST